MKGFKIGDKVVIKKLNNENIYNHLYPMTEYRYYLRFRKQYFNKVGVIKEYDGWRGSNGQYWIRINSLDDFDWFYGEELKKFDDIFDIKLKFVKELL